MWGSVCRTARPPRTCRCATSCGRCAGWWRATRRPGTRPPSSSDCTPVGSRRRTTWPCCSSSWTSQQRRRAWSGSARRRGKPGPLRSCGTCSFDAAQQQPLVLVVENLHWSDPTSEAWLASLVERLAEAAVLLLGTYRPGYQPAWGAHSAVTQVALAPLRAQDSRTVVQAVLGAVSLPEAQLRAMVAQAGGNPFFLEELAWHARNRAADLPGAVPETVHAVLAARMDRLPPEAKRLLQTASVLGMHMARPLLQASDRAARCELQRVSPTLQTAEFLYETRLVPELGLHLQARADPGGRLSVPPPAHPAARPPAHGAGVRRALS